MSSKIQGIALHGLILASLGGTLFGYGTGLTDPILSYLKYKNKTSKPVIFVEDSAELTRWVSLFAASMIFGAFVGALAIVFIIDNIKVALYAISGVGIIGTTLAIFDTGFTWLSYIGRFLIGVSIGATSGAVPLYMSVAFRTELKYLGTMFQFTITLFIWIAMSIGFPSVVANPAVTLPIHRVLMAPLYIFYAAFIVLALFVLKENPMYLIKNGRKEEAKQVLGDIYNADEVEEQVKSIEKDLAIESKSLGEIFSSYKLAVGICILIAFGQQMTGINTLIYFWGEIIKDKKTADAVLTDAAKSAAANKKQLGVCLLMLWNMLTSMASIPIVNKIGRKTLVLGGLYAMSLSMFLTGIAALFPALSFWVTVTFLALFFLAFELSVGPLLFVFVFELLDETTRGPIGTLIVGLSWLFNFILTVGFNGLNKAMDPNGDKGAVFFLFGSIGLVTGLALSIMIVETRNKTTAEIQKELKEKFA